MENEERPAKDENAATDESRATDGNASAAGEEGEFKLKIRKLEMPVRPRGVLAE